MCLTSLSTGDPAFPYRRGGKPHRKMRFGDLLQPSPLAFLDIFASLVWAVCERLSVRLLSGGVVWKAFLALFFYIFARYLIACDADSLFLLAICISLFHTAFGLHGSDIRCGREAVCRARLR